MIDAAQLAAATAAFQEEARHWKRLPRHNVGRPFVAERHAEPGRQRPFANNVETPSYTFETAAYDTEAERETAIVRACVLKAIEAIQRRDAA
jgi:hypothetical protein